MLTDEQLLRYSRQIMLPEVEIDGQEALASGQSPHSGRRWIG